jgi:hypothetical protein
MRTEAILGVAKEPARTTTDALRSPGGAKVG